jgi:HEAT repeat protein
VACGDTTVLLWDLTGKLSAAVRTKGKPRPQEFNALWSDLDGADAAQAYCLVQYLTAHPAEGTALVRARLFRAKVKAFDEAAVNRLIKDLDHDDFERREAASKALAEFGNPASGALIKALQATRSAEKKRRISELLDALHATGPRPEMVRPTRALEVLERIGTPEAKQVLEDLTKGDPDAPLTQEAKATLKRLTAPK